MCAKTRSPPPLLVGICVGPDWLVAEEGELGYGGGNGPAALMMEEVVGGVNGACRAAGEGRGAGVLGDLLDDMDGAPGSRIQSLHRYVAQTSGDAAGLEMVIATYKQSWRLSACAL